MLARLGKFVLFSGEMALVAFNKFGARSFYSHILIRSDAVVRRLVRLGKGWNRRHICIGLYFQRCF